jgi:sugar lactone lactonase YvrE
VLEFDLDSAQLRRRLVPPVAGGSVGDLALDGGGTVYVADPEAGRIYSAPPTASGLDVLVDAGPITSTQGLTVAADGQHLYAADYLRGIARVHLASGRVQLLEAPDRLALTGIDGLVLAGDSLVAIQNSLNPHRVLRLRLDPSGTSVVSGEVLERRNPHFDEPTLGVRVENDFYYVANSQYEAFDRQGRPDPARLREPVILRMRLPWLEGGP